ncbi:MAG: hypothetical protein WD048_01820 [Chitinophagales bacterium]
MGIRVDTSTVDSMLDEYMQYLKLGNNEFEFHPVTEYQQAPIHFEWYNINHNKNDFNTRSSGKELSCKNTYKVFCIGASTTLGVLLEDQHTWPSFLYRILNENKDENACYNVTNYGVASFSPTQETNQFIHLLKLGHRPSLVIFMDGTSFGSTHDGSEFSSKIFNRFNYSGLKLADFPKFFSLLPAIKLINGKPINDEVDFFKTDEEYDLLNVESTTEYNDIIVNRFIENARIRKSIADLYGVEIIQILQPNAYINYNRKYFSKTVQGWMENETLVEKNHRYIYNKILESDVGFVDFSELLIEYEKPAIIDIVHYSPDFNRYLAAKVNELLSETKDMVPYRFEEDSATGYFFTPKKNTSIGLN